jgi:hypothetical protein
MKGVYPDHSFATFYTPFLSPPTPPCRFTLPETDTEQNRDHPDQKRYVPKRMLPQIKESH